MTVQVFMDRKCRSCGLLFLPVDWLTWRLKGYCRESCVPMFPINEIDFLCAIRPEINLWRFETQPSDADDDSRVCKIVFWLAADTEKRAILEYAFGKLIVCLEPATDPYFFDLKRLHEDIGVWSWQKQIREKSWAGDAHLHLLDALCRLCPPTAAQIAAGKKRAADETPKTGSLL